MMSENSLGSRERQRAGLSGIPEIPILGVRTGPKKVLGSPSSPHGTFGADGDLSTEASQEVHGSYATDSAPGGSTASERMVPSHSHSVCEEESAATVQHENGESCTCPHCRLNTAISFLYRNQRRSSPHVMQARPSTQHGGFDLALPDLPVIEEPKQVAVCPVYKCFGFCPYSIACYLPHNEETRALPRLPRLATATEEMERIKIRAAYMQHNDCWTCDVCGYEDIDTGCDAPLGTEQSFRYCPKCTFACYFPHITYLLERLLDGVGEDYTIFKGEVDKARREIPDLLKIPFSHEAHRIANVHFAWSLLRPVDARDAIESALKYFPEMESLISLGSAGGYVEHVFNRVMNPFPMREEWGVDRSKYPVSSFDGVRCSFYGQRTITIFAFDELSLRCPYSVHISIGGPISVFSLNCRLSALLLCWPPFGSRQREESSMGFEALEYYTQHGGRLVIFIGDVGATGDWRFHLLLRSHYKLVRDYPVRRELPRWSPPEMGYVYGGSDSIGVYERRATPLDLSAYY